MYRKSFTKFRISEHSLEIEKERYYNKIPREQRLCKAIEYTKHFLLHCKVNDALRQIIVQNCSAENPNFPNLTDEQKLVYLLHPASKNTGSFLKLRLIK